MGIRRRDQWRRREIKQSSTVTVDYISNRVTFRLTIYQVIQILKQGHAIQIDFPSYFIMKEFGVVRKHCFKMYHAHPRLYSPYLRTKKNKPPFTHTGSSNLAPPTQVL